MTEVTDDLTAFTKDFFNPGAEPPVEAADTSEEAPAADTAEVEEAVTEAETAEETGQQDDEAAKPKKRTTADRLKLKAAENARLAQQLEELRREMEALKGSKPLTDDKPAATGDAGPEKPDPAKYQYGELDPQYLEALADYRADLKIAKFQASLREQQEKERKQEAELRASATLQEKATAIEQAGSSKYADFHELVVEGGQNGEYPLTQEMFELVAETGAPADILYHLASNPEEAAKVAKMPLTQQALWFGRMDAKFSQPVQPTVKKVTAAPPPPASTPKGSGSKSGPSLTDIDDPRALALMTKALFG